MGIYEHGKGLAEAIIMGQEVARSLPKPAVPSLPIEFTEMPKPLSYYYPPYHYKTVNANSSEKIFDFKVPPEHILHVELIGNNWSEYSYFEFMVDGSLIEKVERVIGFINSPLNIRHRYMHANHSVLVVGYNTSLTQIMMEWLCDGTIYLRNDFKKILGT